MLDRFSTQAALYARYRIDYPAALYAELLASVTARARAWDCATGNGQVATVLAEYFAHVNATDISQAQLQRAPARANITYQPASAEQTPFADHTFDLITAAQAVHWFDAAAFHKEARRVGRPGATVAEWGYGLVQLGPELDFLLAHFYRNTIGPYWDANRWHIDDEYARIPFPFRQVRHRRYLVRRSWSAAWFLQYLRTWSGVVKYEQQRGQDPVQLIADEVTDRWGTTDREVSFPMFLRSGLIP